MGTTRGRESGRLTFERGGEGGEGAEHEQRGDEVGEADGHGDAPVREPPRRRGAATERRSPRYSPRHVEADSAAAIPTAAGAALRSPAAAPDSRAPRLLDLARGRRSTRRAGRYAALQPRSRRAAAKVLVEASGIPAGQGTSLSPFSFGPSRYCKWKKLWRSLGGGD